MSPHMPTSGKEAQKPQDWNFLQAAATPQVVTYPPKATPQPCPCRYLSSATLLWTEQSQDLTRSALLLPASVCRIWKLRNVRKSLKKRKKEKRWGPSCLASPAALNPGCGSHAGCPSRPHSPQSLPPAHFPKPGCFRRKYSTRHRGRYTSPPLPCWEPRVTKGDPLPG